MVLIDNPLTNGVTATLLTAPDGELLGIRVEWSIKPELLGCQYHDDSRVQLNPGPVVRDIGVSITDGTAAFSHEMLDCNTQYTPTVVAVVVTDPGPPISTVTRTESSASLFYRGKTSANHAASDSVHYIILYDLCHCVSTTTACSYNK